jgi:hypothetical protein
MSRTARLIRRREGKTTFDTELGMSAAKAALGVA